MADPVEVLEAWFLDHDEPWFECIANAPHVASEIRPEEGALAIARRAMASASPPVVADESVIIEVCYRIRGK